MRRTIHRLTDRGLAAALALLFIASACATAKKSSKDDVVFPPPPDKARVRWIRSFRTEGDINHSTWRKILNVIVPYDSSNAVTAPTGLALSPDERTLYVAMPHTSRVVAVDLKAGKFEAIGRAGRSPLVRPIGVAVDGEGVVYVTDKGANAVIAYAKDGSILRKFGEGRLLEPTGIAIDRRNQIVYVVNDSSKQEGRHSVEAFSLAGKHLRTIGGTRSPEIGSFNFPRGVAVSRSGELYVADMLNFRVQVFDAKGQPMRSFGTAGANYPGQFDKIHSVGFDGFGNVYVADAMQGIHILNEDGEPLMMFGPPLARASSAVVVDSKNRIYVADLLHSVHEFQLVNTTAADSRPKPPSTDKQVAPAAPARAPAGSPAPAAAERR